MQRSPTLDQAGSFAPEQEIRFGDLEYVTDARGDLVINGFLALPREPTNPEALTSDSLSVPIPGPGLGSDLALSSDPTPAPENQVLPLAGHIRSIGAPELNSDGCPNENPVDLSFLSEMLDRIQRMNITNGPSSD